MASHKNLPRNPDARTLDLADAHYWSQSRDVRVLNALLYLALAREAAERDDFERACRGYRRALDTWQAANDYSSDAWRAEQEWTNQEYASFLLGANTGQA